MDIWQSTIRSTFALDCSISNLSHYLHLLSNLLTVDFTIDKCVLRGSEQEFSQREIKMKLEVCGQKSVFVSKGLLMVTEFLDQNHDSSVVIFCNSRNQSLHLSSHLIKKLDMVKLSVNVLNINGSLDKMDKFWRIVSSVTIAIVQRVIFERW
jgi:hypothetical protein